MTATARPRRHTYVPVAVKRKPGPPKGRGRAYAARRDEDAEVLRQAIALVEFTAEPITAGAIMGAIGCNVAQWRAIRDRLTAHPCIVASASGTYRWDKRGRK